MKPRVLIVDDSLENRLILEQKMLIDGYDVVTAEDGIEGIARAHDFAPDIILLDVMMPRMDGYEACRRLKSDEATRYTPIILLTAKGDIEDKVMGLEVGAEDYVVKPYSVVEVSARVKSLLRMRAMQAKLNESTKLAALGEMVDGIAHELRNPIVTIGGMARRLYEHETDTEHKRYAKTILDAADRMEKMARRIDDYKGVLVSDFRVGNINDAVNPAVEELRAFISGKNIKIALELLPVPPPMRIDARNLKVALFGILQNSVEAIEDRGVIDVKTSVESDGMLVLTVVDTGVGIDDKSINDIFNPFHTSKMTGAGMGLTIAHRIVQDHGGSIEVRSRKNEGTEVTLKFPVADKGSLYRQ